MKTKQIDPKYRIEVKATSCDGPEALAPFAGVLDEIFASCAIEVVNLSGVPIPDDEPLILFRARDYLAVPMLEHYFKLAVADGCTDFHLVGIDNRIEAFRRFAAEHPERMKQPGVTRGA